MTHVAIVHEHLKVEIEGMDRVWSLHSKLEIPLQHVAGARFNPTQAEEIWMKGIRIAGTRIPGHIAAGTIRQEGGWVFFDVRDPKRTVIIDLHDEHYERLVLEVDDPPGIAELVNAAVAGRGSSES